jgi:hypothetical protein
MNLVMRPYFTICQVGTWFDLLRIRLRKIRCHIGQKAVQKFGIMREDARVISASSVRVSRQIQF